MIPWWLPGKEPLVRTGMAGLVFSQIICTDCCCPLKLQETKRRRWYHGVRSEFLHSMLQWTPMMHLFSRLSLMFFMNMCHRCAAPGDLRRFLNRRPRCIVFGVFCEGIIAGCDMLRIDSLYSDISDSVLGQILRQKQRSFTCNPSRCFAEISNLQPIERFSLPNAWYDKKLIETWSPSTFCEVKMICKLGVLPFEYVGARNCCWACEQV